MQGRIAREGAKRDMLIVYMNTSWRGERARSKGGIICGQMLSGTVILCPIIHCHFGPRRIFQVFVEVIISFQSPIRCPPSTTLGIYNHGSNFRQMLRKVAKVA